MPSRDSRSFRKSSVFVLYRTCSGQVGHTVVRYRTRISFFEINLKSNKECNQNYAQGKTIKLTFKEADFKTGFYVNFKGQLIH